MKRIGLLGASGSIGSQSLDVIRRDSGLKLSYFTVHSNISRAKEIIEEFQPAYCLVTSSLASQLGQEYEGTKILGAGDLEYLIKEVEVDIVLNAMMGMSGLAASWWILDSGLKLALANKESLVSAGGLLKDLVVKKGGQILPVDSEHSALWQCMEGENKKGIEKLILTASGGAFRDISKEEMLRKPASQALKHPNWAMGQKITIDSATLMNKGLEVMEAYWLFDIALEDIDVIIHRESIIHSMVQYRDGSVLAQLGISDMRQPIHYALNEKVRQNLDLERLDFNKLTSLNFQAVDHDKYPSLGFAYRALEEGGNRPLVLNTVNELLVEKYLEDRIGLKELFEGLDESFNEKFFQPQSLEDLLEEENRIRRKMK